jgi:uncharacterized iron-regulated membrane protein
MRCSRLNRFIHRWGSIVVAVPVLVVVSTGILLQLKKEFAWIQPPTQTGSSQDLAISFERILAVAKAVPEAAIESWADVDRLDIRPDKGMVKVRAKNRWEIQIDTKTGAVLQLAYRRSDIVESIHDGSFFHPNFRLWVFLPAALVLGVLWATGIYLFFLPYFANGKKSQDKPRARSQATLSTTLESECA